jgi:hypothetical protein
MERLWVLKRQRAFPQRQLLEQAEIVGIRLRDGSVRASEAIASESRILDALEIEGQKVLGLDLKSGNELLRSIKGGLKRPGEIEGSFRGASKIGYQIAKEEKIVKEAATGGAKLIFKGKDVRTGRIVTVEVDPMNFGTNVVSYVEVMPN